MAFFGNVGASSTPAKPTGGLFSTFGTGAATSTIPFGTPATSTAAAPGFGAAPAFGTSGFGTAPTSAAPTMAGYGTGAFGIGGFGTGVKATTTAPTLGGFGGFGANTTTVTTSAPTFFGGAAATNTAPAFGNFGSGTANTAAPAFGGFGTGTAALPTQAFGGFGTGTTATSTAAPAFGGFGTGIATSAPTAFGGFGTGTATTKPSNFGGFGTGAFGTTGFGTGFNKPAINTVTPGFGSFGGTTNFMLGQPQQQAPQVSPDEAFAHSIFNVSIYGDERDTILAKWNYLQAMWGIGKSFYSQSAPPVDITPQNYLCRFKAMGYSRLPGKDNKMGLVAINFNKTITEVKAQEQQIITNLNNIFGNKPNLLINIETCKEHEDKKCQLVIYIEEKSQLVPNETKRILATDIANYLNQATVQSQLSNLGVIQVLALVLPDEDQLREYFENPPKGIDARMWRQAKEDNPDPTKFLPVPMIGFNDLKWRIKCQENEIETHALYMRKVEKDLSELRQRHLAATARILEHKRKLAELSHQILKIIVKQECTRKVGLALTPEEEALRTKLENMQALISAPTQFKGRLNELLSQMRMQRNQYSLTGANEYIIDKDAEEEMKGFLSMQQKAMEVLTDTVTKDLKSLQIIIDGLPELMRG